MKKSNLIIAMAMSITSMSAMATDDQAASAGGQPAHHKPMTHDQWNQRAEQRFQQADVNKDGVVTHPEAKEARQEFRAQHEQRRAERQARKHEAATVAPEQN